MLSILLSSVERIWAIAISVAILISLVYEWWLKEEPIYLVWNLDEQLLSTAVGGEPLEQSLAIKRLNLLFKIIYLQIKRKDRADLHVYVYPDSVDQQSYRRLRVAVRLASIKLKSD